MDEFGTGEKKKEHQTRLAGRKAEKKKRKKEKTIGDENTKLDAAKRNPKAFAIKSSVKAERQFRRKQDVLAKREHKPKIDRTPLEPPPYVRVCLFL